MKKLLLLILTTTVLLGCFKDDGDDNTQFSPLQVKDFVWKGLNYVYLYKDNVPNLANDRFANDSQYQEFLESYSSPETLFESLIYDRNTVDRFSWIVDDYVTLEQNFSGISLSSGIDYTLAIAPNTQDDVVAIVNYILPNSPASSTNIKRGDFFNTINGTKMMRNNYRSLLGLDTYTIGLASFDNKGTSDQSDDEIVANGQEVEITKVQYSENPVYLHKTFNIANKKVGYLIYNSFINEYDRQLNDVFTTFKNENVNELVLDLRYNGGGSVNTSILLSGMITGQFDGQIIAKQKWNSDIQAQIEADDPEDLIYRFTNSQNNLTLSNLNLNKVYILTTRRTASASELVINSLRPFIDVVVIGETTTGKSQASITLYDSDNYRKQNVNPNHTYAMQPLVLQTVNKNDVVVPATGFVPNIERREIYSNMGVLGDENEPLLAEALSQISGVPNKLANYKTQTPIIKSFSNGKAFNRFNNEMYIEIPEGLNFK